MQSEQLKAELRAILRLEERPMPDWEDVKRRCLELNGWLLAEGPWTYPAIVSQYLDDADIRSKDVRYGARQRHQLGQWLGAEVL